MDHPLLFRCQRAFLTGLTRLYGNRFILPHSKDSSRLRRAVLNDERVSYSVYNHATNFVNKQAYSVLYKTDSHHHCYPVILTSTYFSHQIDARNARQIQNPWTLGY